MPDNIISMEEVIRRNAELNEKLEKHLKSIDDTTKKLEKKTDDLEKTFNESIGSYKESIENYKDELKEEITKSNNNLEAIVNNIEETKDENEKYFDEQINSLEEYKAIVVEHRDNGKEQINLLMAISSSGKESFEKTKAMSDKLVGILNNSNKMTQVLGKSSSTSLVPTRPVSGAIGYDKVTVLGEAARKQRVKKLGDIIEPPILGKAKVGNTVGGDFTKFGELQKKTNGINKKILELLGGDKKGFKGILDEFLGAKGRTALGIGSLVVSGVTGLFAVSAAKHGDTTQGKFWGGISALTGLLGLKAIYSGGKAAAKGLTKTGFGKTILGKESVQNVGKAASKINNIGTFAAIAGTAGAIGGSIGGGELGKKIGGEGGERIGSTIGSYGGAVLGTTGAGAIKGALTKTGIKTGAKLGLKASLGSIVPGVGMVTNGVEAIDYFRKGNVGQGILAGVGALAGAASLAAAVTGVGLPLAGALSAVSTACSVGNSIIDVVSANTDAINGNTNVNETQNEILDEEGDDANYTDAPTQESNKSNAVTNDAISITKNDIQTLRWEMDEMRRLGENVDAEKYNEVLRVESEFKKMAQRKDERQEDFKIWTDVIKDLNKLVENTNPKNDSTNVILVGGNNY